MENAGTSSEKMGNGKHVSLDVNKLAESMKGKLNILRPFSDKCCIYRVPKRLRELNKKAYTPQVISIGPLHHGKEELKEMEEHKKLYLMQFLEWSMVSVEDFIAAIAQREARLRNSYAETFENLGADEFVEMVLLDCSFVLVYLLKRRFSRYRDSNTDRIFDKPWMSNEIRFDLCLLENQLPFFILEDLLELSKIQEEYSMIKLTHAFLSDLWDMWVPANTLGQINISNVVHFVDFLRICQQPAQQTQPKLETLTAPSATELHQVEIKFKLSTNKNLFDIKFNVSREILEIPHLKIVDDTEILLRNLQAYEQCHCDDHCIIGNYITMINLIVRATKDVKMLAEKGIIENWLRDDDAVLCLFHGLSNGNLIASDNFYFSGVVDDLNKYYKKRTYKWKAELKQKYFDSPWTIISVVPAVVLLLLTFIQTMCSILQIK